MGFFDSIKNVFSPVTDTVRGLGRIARGNFDEGFGDIKSSVGANLSDIGALASVIPGIGQVAGAGLMAGGNLLGGQDKGLTGELGKLLGGGGRGDLAAAGGAQALAQILGQGEGGGDGEGFLGSIGDILGKGADAAGGALSTLGGGNPLIGAGALALITKQLREQSKARESAQEFNQKRLDTLSETLQKAEEQFDQRAPLRQGGQAGAINALASLGSDPFRKFLERGGAGVKPGQFLQRG